MAEIEQLDDQAPKPRKSGRVLATLALLLALAAASGVGYVYWLTVWQADNAAAEQISALQSQLVAERERGVGQAEAAEAERVQLKQDLAAQVLVLAATRTALAEVAAAPQDDAPPAPREWQLAEVEYLLRIANHRLRLEADADGARAMLVAADGVLGRLEDFAFHEVRALLAEEVASLRAFEGADVQGVYLRVEAAKGLLHRLPLRLPEYTLSGEEPREDTVAPSSETGSSMLERLFARLGGMVRFRRHDIETLRPLLPPDQAEYLEQHLRLALDRAQLAALRGDQAIFVASVTAARDWLHEFVDPERESAMTIREELDTLLSVDLEAPLPDISRSLARLRELRRGVDGDA